MLYTVSAVQILATVDAIEELDKRGKAGRDKVGACRSSRYGPGGNRLTCFLEILPIYKTE